MISLYRTPEINPYFNPMILGDNHTPNTNPNKNKATPAVTAS